MNSIESCPAPSGRAALQRPTQRVAATSLAALVLLCVLWETLLAPLRPGGSSFVLKALPLAIALPGLFRGRLRTFQWMSLLVLAYFTEGAVRAWSEPQPVRALAWTEIVLACVLFGACLAHVWSRRQPRIRTDGGRAGTTATLPPKSCP